MVEMFKDILKQIQIEIEREKYGREQSQESLLQLMEERDLDLVKEVEQFNLNERALKNQLAEKERHI